MTYREMLDLYRRGHLDEETRRKLEADIEKQDAISEYLFDRSDIPDLEEIPLPEPEQEDGQFIALVQRSIRRAFVKMGVIVGAVVLVLVLGAVFLLPHAVDQFYYDPNEVVGADAKYPDLTTTRMSLDLGVYSELFLPGQRRNNAIATPQGYGVYDLTIPQNVSRTGAFRTFNGRLTRDELLFYDGDALRHPAGNAFRFPEELDKNPNSNTPPWGTSEEAKANLADLDDSGWYQGFISLNRVFSYADFLTWMEENELDTSLWCAVPVTDENGDLSRTLIGFNVGQGGMCLDWDRETYPHLSLLDNGNPDTDPRDPEVMEEHFLSMLKWTRDNPEFSEMMHTNVGHMPQFIMDSVEREGLRVYGFSITAKKSELVELAEDPDVGYVFAEPAVS